jgi:DNA-binding response OmpR family regulator
VALPATAPVALKILLVEDDRTVAEVICALLQARGHQVSHVVNGLQALSLIATEEFDAGLLDLDLPGIDGLSLARQIRAMGKRLPLLAVTARSDAQAEGEVCQAGFDAYVRKPVTGVLLAEALVGMLREQDPATAKELA